MTGVNSQVVRTLSTQRLHARKEPVHSVAHAVRKDRREGPLSPASLPGSLQTVTLLVSSNVSCQLSHLCLKHRTACRLCPPLSLMGLHGQA